MAEIKTGIFAKNVQKRLNRAQEKVLQKLGKADETKDEQFEQVVLNFKRQESEGGRLQREMKAYMSAIKGMQQASINLTQSLHEVYEPDWHGKDDIVTIGKDCDALWEDFHNKLVDSTLLNLDAYLLQFPDLKMRVAKRSRKLIDYDSARHHLETLQAAGMKNDRKMIKAEEELKKAQKVFDELDVGLQDELPTLWDCRVDFYISTFKIVTSLEAKFHREISQVCKELYELSPLRTRTSHERSVRSQSGLVLNSHLNVLTLGDVPEPRLVSLMKAGFSSQEKMPIPSVVIEPASSNEGDDDHDADIISPTIIGGNVVTGEHASITHMSASGGASGLPADFLYKVETMHDFEAANSDELDLKRGDVVLVVPTDAGWLTGIKEREWITLGTGAQRGLFPENFIQRLE
uniref:Amphiphysin n=1 Tax=Nothobranchius furzeri TaxID=105023 RepID=A0A8C6LF05_NOTFU